MESASMQTFLHHHAVTIKHISIELTKVVTTNYENVCEDTTFNLIIPTVYNLKVT